MPQFGSSGVAVYSENENGKYGVVTVEGENSNAFLTAMLRNVVVHAYTGYWQRSEDIPFSDENFLTIDCMRLNVESTTDPHILVALLVRFRNIQKLYVRCVKDDSAVITAYCVRQGIEVETCS